MKGLQRWRVHMIVSKTEKQKFLAYQDVDAMFEEGAKSEAIQKTIVTMKGIVMRHHIEITDTHAQTPEANQRCAICGKMKRESLTLVYKEKE